MTPDEPCHSPLADVTLPVAQIVPPAILQLKRLTRDLRHYVGAFQELLREAMAQEDRPSREAFLALRASIERMRHEMIASGEIARASVAAIARQDPTELLALRDQLTGYLAALNPDATSPNQHATSVATGGDAGPDQPNR
ncbi:hypothetical protein [Dongia sp.]|uniref:hypothetical protein n=1 Tax=Dongia sp. TaxID=1977262 RepID=UPI0035B07954